MHTKEFISALLCLTFNWVVPGLSYGSGTDYHFNGFLQFFQVNA